MFGLQITTSHQHIVYWILWTVNIYWGKFKLLDMVSYRDLVKDFICNHDIDSVTSLHFSMANLLGSEIHSQEWWVPWGWKIWENLIFTMPPWNKIDPNRWGLSSNSSAFLAFFETGFLWLERDPWIVLIVHPSLEDYIGSDFAKKRLDWMQSNLICKACIQSMNLLFLLLHQQKLYQNSLHCLLGTAALSSTRMSSF